MQEKYVSEFEVTMK